MGLLVGLLGFLNEGLEVRVILNVMDDLVWPQGSYPESFRLLSSCSVKLQMIKE